MIERYLTNTRMSQIVVNGERIYLAGQVPETATADIYVQTREVLSKVERLLARVDAGKNDLLSATVWLTDIADFAAFNEVWEDWMPSGCAPTRACVQAGLARDGLRVEVAVIAARRGHDH